MDRRVKSPHQVILRMGDKEVFNFTIPQTDTRFVKGEDLYEMAYAEILKRQNDRSLQRRSTDPVAGKWDNFTVHWYFFSYTCNARGQRIKDAA